MKSENVSFIKAIKELKDNFKIVDNCITEENVNSNFEYIYTTKKIEFHLTIFNVYDSETHNTYRARPYNMTFHRLSKLSGKHDRDLTPYEIEKYKKDTLVLDGDKCISNAFDFLSKFRGEERKAKNKLVEYNLQLHAHSGSGFDTWVIINNLPCDKHIVDIINMEKVLIL